MKLKNAARIERAVDGTLGLLLLPFKLVAIILYYIMKPFIWLNDKRTFFMAWFGNKLLRRCDEVKDGTIQNQELIKRYTAVQIKYLMEHKSN